MITLKSMPKLQGKCLVCKSEFPIVYGKINIDYPVLSVNIRCPNCGFEGFEWYDLEYSCTTGTVENKQVVEYNLN
jgi:hypothetical protein